MNITITKDQMVKKINDYFTGLLESYSCGGAIDSKASYKIFKHFFSDGRDLNVSGNFLYECYNNHDTSIVASGLAAKDNCDDLIVMLYERITN